MFREMYSNSEYEAQEISTQDCEGISSKHSSTIPPYPSWAACWLAHPSLMAALQAVLCPANVYHISTFIA